MLPEFIHRLVFGLLSGLMHILPVSSEAHQLLYAHFFNFHPDDPWLRACCLLGTTIALYVMQHQNISHILRENRRHKNIKQSKSHPAEPAAVCTANLVFTSLWLLIPAVLVSGFAANLIDDFILLAILCFINGFMLFIPRLIATGDKTAVSMSRFDGLLMGLFGALGVFPGISSIGAMATIARFRGADRSFIVQLSLLMLLIPMILLTALSFGSALIFTPEMNVWMVLGDILSGVTAFLGSCAGIYGIRKLCLYKDISVFSFYSWGAAIVALVLYLIN